MKASEKRLITGVVTFFVYSLISIWVIGTEQTTMQDRAGIAAIGMFCVFMSMMFPFENSKSDSNQDGLA